MKRWPSNSKQPGPRKAVEAKRILAVAVAAGVWGSGLTAQAHADCAQDMQKLAQARNVELQKINEFAKSFHGLWIRGSFAPNPGLSTPKPP
jgi:hypothetical protein